MAAEIKINTKYAKRDVERMENAAIALEDAQKKYIDLKAHIESVYKGNASIALADAVEHEALVCKDCAEKLNTAAGELRNTIQKYEEYNEKMIKSINSK